MPQSYLIASLAGSCKNIFEMLAGLKAGGYSC